MLYDGSEELAAFIWLCHFMTDRLEEKVMDGHFSIPLADLDEVTLR